MTGEKNAGILYYSTHSKIAPLGDPALLFPAHGSGRRAGDISDRDDSTLGIEKGTIPSSRKAAWIRRIPENVRNGRKRAWLSIAVHRRRLPGRISRFPANADAFGSSYRFKKHGQTMALVVNEFGDMHGLVPLNDVMEALVGALAQLKDFVGIQLKGVTQSAGC